MTIRTKYRAEAPADGNRYVRYAGAGAYAWCETSVIDRKGWRYDIAQGECDAEDLPVDVRAAALEQKGTFPGYVSWPL
jgi:hypothetical protein